MPSDTRRLRSSPRRRELAANSSKRRRPSSRLICPLVQPGLDQAVALLERPAGRAQHDGEAVADRLSDAFGAFGMLMLFCHALSLGRPMPIYEYRCADCGKRPSIFFKSLMAIESST